MFRCAISAFRTIRPLAIPYYNAARIISAEARNFHSLNPTVNIITNTNFRTTTLLNNKHILDISKSLVPSRSVTKFSLKKGKRKTVKAAVNRFFRLHWGGWIRTKIGRHKRLWKKSSKQKRRLRQHVFCNGTQNKLLDKMVTNFWKRPKYYVDDPYAPYHTREELPCTRKKPRDIY